VFVSAAATGEVQQDLEFFLQHFNATFQAAQQSGDDSDSG
jgi:hypothetical protein